MQSSSETLICDSGAFSTRWLVDLIKARDNPLWMILKDSYNEKPPGSDYISTRARKYALNFQYFDYGGRKV